MKKLLSYKNKKQRGVALVFTLGILGLLTVIALGFASTALINRKVAENCGNLFYAQTIARSIALARAQYALQNIAAIEQFYSTSTTNPTYDWLWKLDTSLQGAQLFQYKYTSVSSGVNAVDWVYVRDTTDNNRILGRYAYVVIPDKGRLDPSVNINDIDTKGIIGLSEKEVGLNNNPWAASLKAAVDASPNYRWTTFWEILNKLGVSNKTSPEWINFFSNGINIGQLKSPETYWVNSATNLNIKDKEELFLRFNLSRSATDWESMTAEKLMGENPVGAETQYWGSSVGSIDFIPWLKNWTCSHGDWTNDLMKKQIAANIIQYNVPEPVNTIDGTTGFRTITDKTATTDWSSNPPAYAGVGRHPMLNEVGFGLKVIADVNATQTSPSPEVWEYTPTYTFYVSWGIELINMFGITQYATVVRLPQVSIEADFNQFVSSVDPNETNMANLIAGNLKTFKTSDTSSYDGGIPYSEFRIDFASTDWLSTISYTSKDTFWKSPSPDTKQVTLPTFSLNGANKKEDIRAQMKIKEVRFIPGNTVLYYGDYNADGLKTQRDIARLDKTSMPTNKFTISTDLAAKDISCFWMCFEANDPRVNHYASDWETKSYSNTVAGDTNAGYPEKVYPGSYISSSGNDDHKNSIVASADIHVEDPAISDPAYQGSGTVVTARLSSSFIKHEPMTSLWELSVISRAEAWKTLNLSVKDLSTTKTYEYDKGDASLLDQIKLNENDERLKYGKVNINTDVHQVLEALLDPAKLIYRKDLYKAVGNDLLAAGTADSTYPSITKISTTPLPHTDCLICSILACTKIYPFMNRTDILVNPAKTSTLPGYTGSGLGDASSGLLKTMQMLLKTGTSKVEKEQIFCKLAPLLKAEPADMVYVIILAQTVRDIGGTPVYIDWNGDESYAAYSAPVSDAVSLKKAGYIRTGESTSYVSGASVHETYPAANTFVGTYEIGADKITSETKLIAVLVQDPVTRKWRIARYQYVE